MKRVRCQTCDRDVPMNESCMLLGKLVCAHCAQERLTALKASGADIPRMAFVPQVDPTVCSNCQMDNGSQEFRTVHGNPLCPNCYDKASVGFPMWVKVSFLILLGLALFSLARNVRFFRAHSEMNASFEALAQGDAEEAYALVASAHKRVPESVDLKQLEDLFHAIVLLREDKCEDALPILQKLEAVFPDDVMVKSLRLQTEGLLAFDNKNYNTFLLRQKALLRMDPNDATFLSGVASAHACQYVVTGKASHKNEALRYLERARKHVTPGNEEVVEDARVRVMHRLESKEIITRDEYYERFGNEEDK